MSNTPAGWYPDGQGSQRYWDGAQWTEHTAPAEPAGSAGQATPSSSAPEPQPEAPDPHAEPTRMAASPFTKPEPVVEPTPQTPQPQGYPQAGGGNPQAGGYPQAGGGYPQQGGGYPQAGGYPPQAGGYGAPTSGGGGKGKLIAIIGGGVAALVVVIILLVVVLGGGGGSGSPKGAVQDFIDGVKDKDCGKIQGATTESYFNDNFGGRDKCESDVDAATSDDEDLSDADISVQDGVEDGDTATVKADITVSVEGESQSITENFTTKKVDGDWLVDDAQVDSSSLPGS